MNRPIGIFDSGLGGLTVFRALREHFPHESLLYLGDTARVPYGTKSAPTVTDYSRQNTQFLLGHQVKAVVVACNTASAFAVPTLQDDFPVPLVGVLEPGALKAIKVSRTARIGIIGTTGTISSQAYANVIRNQCPEAHIVSQACPLFVPLVEEGWLEHEVTHQVAADYLTPLQQAEVDTMILGCTHYPMLTPVIQKVMGLSVQLVDSAHAVAEALEKQLREKDLLAPADSTGSDRFFVTDSAERFRKVGEIFLGRPLAAVEEVTIA